MKITSEQLKELRNATGISVMQCKKALEEAEGDMKKASIILQKKGGEAASKKSDRAFGSGAIGAYVHNTNEVATLVTVSCETDFVSKNEEFISLARDIAMHVAGVSPLAITRDEISEEELTKVREVFAKDVADKPANMQDKIIDGKMDAYYKDRVLMEQAFIKDADKTIADLIQGAVQKFGENIAVTEMYRMSVK